jgi:hypothetical protein
LSGKHGVREVLDCVRIKWVYLKEAVRARDGFIWSILGIVEGVF